MKRNAALILSMVILCSLAACRKGSETAAKGGAPKAKESIVVAAAAEPDSFFPFDSDKTTNQDEVPILHNIYESPLKMMPDGSKAPLLATDWSISEDGKEYTLKLRDDVYFHNGKKMTAEDVAFSLNGAAATALGTTLLVNYDTTEVIDANTVVVRLTTPYAPFLNSLSSRYALVVDKEYFDKVGISGYQAAPIGTGPYKFIERASGDHITLAVNENYWGGPPAVKNITFKVMTDANTQMLALENGEVDVLINANVSQVVRLPENGSVKWASTEAASIQALGINSLKGPGANLDFRRAIQCGLNKKEVILGVLEGMVEPIDIYMAKSFSGHPDEGTYKTVPYDLEKAKEYLKASGYKGEEFMIVTLSGGKDEQAAQIIQGQLIELGINCTVNAVDAPSYLDIVSYGTGDWGGIVRATGVSVIDADGLYVQYYGDYYKARKTYTRGWPSDRKDILLAAGRVETDAEKRKAIYAEISDLITDAAHQVMLFCNLSVVAYNKELQGVVPRVLTGLYYFNDWHY